MNKGIVIKFNANQKYTTDAVSEVQTAASAMMRIFRIRCLPTGRIWQADLHLAILNTQVAVNTVDIGLAQLAMHPHMKRQAVRILFIWRSVRQLFTERISGCQNYKISI